MHEGSQHTGSCGVLEKGRRTLGSISVLKHARPLVHDDEKVDWLGSWGFMAVHAAAVAGVLLVGISWVAALFCLATYYGRVFGVTGGYHRYFSHRSYRTTRWFQFVMGWIGCSAAQMGSLWWAAHHRHHHRHTDTESDIHSPGPKGFLFAHCGWILCRKYVRTNMKAIPDFARFPELVFMNRFHLLPPVILAGSMLVLGWALGRWAPGLGTNGPQMLVWGFFVSTVALYHAKFSINSLAHVFGRRRFRTKDDSKNNWFLSVLTLGEGWHNNHHRYPYSERQGLYWWEFDGTHYILKMLSWLGIVWDLNKPPREVYEEALAGG